METLYSRQKKQNLEEKKRVDQKRFEDQLKHYRVRQRELISNPEESKVRTQIRNRVAPKNPEIRRESPRLETVAEVEVENFEESIEEPINTQLREIEAEEHKIEEMLKDLIIKRPVVLIEQEFNTTKHSVQSNHNRKKSIEEPKRTAISAVDKPPRKTKWSVKSDPVNNSPYKQPWTQNPKIPDFKQRAPVKQLKFSNRRRIIAGNIIKVNPNVDIKYLLKE